MANKPHKYPRILIRWDITQSVRYRKGSYIEPGKCMGCGTFFQRIGELYCCITVEWSYMRGDDEYKYFCPQCAIDRGYAYVKKQEVVASLRPIKKTRDRHGNTERTYDLPHPHYMKTWEEPD